MRALAISALLMLTLTTPARATIGDCGQPHSDGARPTLGDVVHILGAALRHRECPPAICDVDDDCRVTVRDALETLRYVIGHGNDLTCREDCPAEGPRCRDTEAPTCGGACPEDYECRDVERDVKVPVCHIPPGNPDEAHTIWISKSAVPAHLEHGDYLGRCRERDCERDGYGDDDCRDDDDDDDDSYCPRDGDDDDDDCRDDDSDDDRDDKDVTFSRDETTWWWQPQSDRECRCKPRDDTTTTTTTSTTNTTSSSTTTSSTTTTRPSGDDTDNDGLLNVDDPCPTDARNLCVGPVAVDGTTLADIRLNAGVGDGTSCGMKVDCNGATWNADFGYNQVDEVSECSAAGGCPIAGVEALFGCTDEATQDLFRCEHWDPPGVQELGYSFDVPDGTYVVNLFFANIFAATSAVGSRTMNLVIEGEVVYPAFDQVAAAGGATQTAVVRSAVVAVADGNGLQISLGHVVENPAIKAIEVLEVEGP